MSRGEVEGAVWLDSRGAPSDDCANGGYADVLLTCGECGLDSLGSWSFSIECLGKLGTKSV